MPKNSTSLLNLVSSSSTRAISKPAATHSSTTTLKEHFNKVCHRIIVSTSPTNNYTLLLNQRFPFFAHQPRRKAIKTLFCFTRVIIIINTIVEYSYIRVLRDVPAIEEPANVTDANLASNRLLHYKCVHCILMKCSLPSSSPHPLAAGISSSKKRTSR